MSRNEHDRGRCDPDFGDLQQASSSLPGNLLLTAPAVARRLGFLRRLPSGMRGKGRLARWLLAGRLPTGEVLLSHRDGLQLVVPSLQDAIGWHLLIDGVYERHEQHLMKRLLALGGLLVDVGANIGAHAVPLAALREDVFVLAVEASAPIVSLLRSNVQRNALTGRVEVIDCAAGAVAGEASFVDADASTFGRGSLTVSQLQSAVRVVVQPLDALVERSGRGLPRVIKVDVEGFEANVFRGATRCLEATSKPWVVFEFIADLECAAGECIGAAQSILLAHGYRLFQLLPSSGRLRAMTEPMLEGYATLVAVDENTTLADMQALGIVVECA